MASSSSAHPPGNLISKETDSLPHHRGWDVFLSHSGEQKPFVKGLEKMLSPLYNVFFDINRPSLPLGEPFPWRIKNAARTCRLAVVVLSDAFFCSKWPMLELSEFVDARVQILPLFYELSPGDLKSKKKLQEWHKKWEELSSEDSRIEVSKWDNGRRTLCSINGLIFKRSDGELAYLEEIVTAIYQMTPPLFRSSHAEVQGRDRLCKVFIDKFEELEQKSQNPSGVYLLGVYGLPGSGKSTLCACLRDNFFSSFAGRSLHLKLPTDPTPTELLGFAKQLLKLTDFGYNREDMMSEIEDLSQMYGILRASNLRSLRVFLVIDNISSQDSIEAVEAILQLGVGAGSRVILVARTWQILYPLLNLPGNPPSHIHYVCDSITVPRINETEAICLLMQSAGGLGLASNYSQKNLKEEYSPVSHRGIPAKVARMCAFCKQSQQDLLYLPFALKIIGCLLRSNRVDFDRQLSELEAIMEDFKEVAVKKIVEESYKKLPKKLKLLFLDVALFMLPCCQSSEWIEESAVELLCLMHECTPATIRRELKELMGLGFLESDFKFNVHDVFLEFAKSVPKAASMYYCRRRIILDSKVTSELSLITADSSAVGLRALILELDKNCRKFDFPAGLRVKAVVVRQCKSLEVMGLAGLMSLVSLEIEDCPRLRHLGFGPGQACTLKRVRWVKNTTYDWMGEADWQQESSSQKSLLQMLQAGRGMQAIRLINKVWYLTSSALGEWHGRPSANGFMSLACQLKALQVLRLVHTGIRSLGDCSSCWPQLRVLEVREGHLEELELGNLPNLKEFFYGDRYVMNSYVESHVQSHPRMLRKAKLLAGCPELEDVCISDPSFEDGMGTLILPPNSRSLSLSNIFHGESVLPDFTSLAHLLEGISVQSHWVLQSIGFTCQLLNLQRIELRLCPNLVIITGLEWLPNLQALHITDCAKLQSLGNLEALRMLATFYVNGCPNLQVLVSDLENLTGLRSLLLYCNVFGNMFKLQNLVNLRCLSLHWKREGQAKNPLSLMGSCEQVDGYNGAQVQSMKYVPLFVVPAHLSVLELSGVQNLVSLDGIHHCLCTLGSLHLGYLPKLTCLQGLRCLMNLWSLDVNHCPAVKELPSLSSLVKVRDLSITHCANLTLLEGLHNMRSLESGKFDGCENLEHLELGGFSQLSFEGCKFANIQAMVGWVLAEEVPEAVWFASFEALTWELTVHLVEKPRERKELAEQLLETLGVYLTKKHPALTKGADDCFDLQPWVDVVKEAWRFSVYEGRMQAAGDSLRMRKLEELMEKLGRVLQRCQSDEHFRASVANYCIVEVRPRVLGEWIRDLVRPCRKRFPSSSTL